MSLEHSPPRAGDASAGRPKGEAGNRPPPTINRIVGESECAEITNLSRTTRWRLMRRNEFPQKVSISPNRKGWMLESILSWLAQREAA